MRLDEIARTRVFLKVVLAICVGGIIVALSTARRSDRQASWSLIGSVAAAVGALWMLASTRDPRRLRRRASSSCRRCAIVFGSMSGVYYWGAGVAGRRDARLRHLLLQPRRESRGSRPRCTRWSRSLHGALGLGIITGVLADRGIVQMTSLRDASIRSRSSASSSSCTSSRSSRRASASASRSTR